MRSAAPPNPLPPWAFSTPPQCHRQHLVTIPDRHKNLQKGCTETLYAPLYALTALCCAASAAAASASPGNVGIAARRPLAGRATDPAGSEPSLPSAAGPCADAPATCRANGHRGHCTILQAKQGLSGSSACNLDNMQRAMRPPVQQCRMFVLRCADKCHASTGRLLCLCTRIQVAGPISTCQPCSATQNLSNGVFRRTGGG